MREIDACHELGSRDSLTGVHTSEVVFRKPCFGKLEIRADGASRQTYGSPAGNPTSKYSLGKE